MPYTRPITEPEDFPSLGCTLEPGAVVSYNDDGIVVDVQEPSDPTPDVPADQQEQ